MLWFGQGLMAFELERLPEQQSGLGLKPESLLLPVLLLAPEPELVVDVSRLRMTLIKAAESLCHGRAAMLCQF